MPVISIDTKKESHGYKISAEDTLWCHHGILSTKQMRQSDDEEMIADILASVLLETPFERSKQKLDALYSGTKEANNIEKKLRKYDSQKLRQEIKTLFGLINKIVREGSKKPKTLQKTIIGRSSVQSIHLKSSILRNMDTIKYRGLSVIRLKIESQAKISYVDDQCFIREHNHTKSVTGPKMEEIISRFNVAKKKSKRKSVNKKIGGKKAGKK